MDDIEFKDSDLFKKQQAAPPVKTTRFPWTAFFLFLLILICGFFALFGWKLYQHMRELERQQPYLMQALSEQEKLDKRIGMLTDNLDELSARTAESNNVQQQLSDLKNEMTRVRQQAEQSAGQENQRVALALLEQAIHSGAPFEVTFDLASRVAPDEIKPQLAQLAGAAAAGLKSKPMLVENYSAPASGGSWWQRWLGRLVRIKPVNQSQDLQSMRTASEQDTSLQAVNWRNDVDALLTAQTILQQWRTLLNQPSQPEPVIQGAPKPDTGEVE